jgi:UDP-glucuronate decarboxylase
MIKNRNILIAGGNGFIGTNLCLKLLDQNNTITIIDNNCSSIEKTYFWESRNIEVLTLDIISESLLLLEKKYDIIINLACKASPKKYQATPFHTLDTCYIGTKNLLSLMRKDSIFLQASTSEIYGDPKVSEQDESYRGNTNCFGKRACYDEGKRIAETLCYEKINEGYNVKIARIFNTYGPYMDKEDGRVITNLLNQIINNKPLTIYGNGKQTRSFQYIDDLLNGFEKLIESSVNTPVNLGNPNEELNMLELTNVILSTLNIDKDYPIIFKELPEDDPVIRKPNINKAITLLNWYPNIKLEEGIRKTYNYLCKNTII